MKIKKRYSNSYKAQLKRQAKDIIDNCNCWLEDENTSEGTKEWFKFEKETIQGLLKVIERRRI